MHMPNMLAKCILVVLAKQASQKCDIVFTTHQY